jgi:hypothetical protein
LAQMCRLGDARTCDPPYTRRVGWRAEDFPRSPPLDKEARRLGNQGYPVNEYSSEELRPERVQRLARRLRELEASGVEPHRILAGEYGVAFIRDECGGDADIAAAAFTLVHSCAESGRVEDR